jgi:hypothetical protein
MVVYIIGVFIGGLDKPGCPKVTVHLSKITVHLPCLNSDGFFKQFLQTGVHRPGVRQQLLRSILRLSTSQGKNTREPEKTATETTNKNLKY